MSFANWSVNPTPRLNLQNLIQASSPDGARAVDGAGEGGGKGEEPAAAKGAKPIVWGKKKKVGGAWEKNSGIISLTQQ